MSRSDSLARAARRTLPAAALAIPLLLLGACASVPLGPSVSSFPGTGRSFDQFRADDADCRRYAGDSLGGTDPSTAQARSATQSAATGTAIGALAGAALGGSSGAATGAGVGLLFGGIAGVGAASDAAYSVQRRYDNAYVQCMYAKGNRVPSAGLTRAPLPPVSQVRPPAVPRAPPGTPAYRYPAPPGYDPRVPPPPPPGYRPDTLPRLPPPPR